MRLYGLLLAAVIIAVPTHGKRFTVPLDSKDPVTSVYRCIDKVHKLGGGICEVPPGAFKTGKKRDLVRRYPDTLIGIQKGKS